MTSYLTFLLFSCLLSTLFPTNKKTKTFIICFSITNFLFYQIIDSQALIYLTLLFILIYIFYSNKVNGYLKFIIFLLICFIAISLISHKIPGFKNILLLSTYITDNASKYNLYLNFDKNFVGIFFAYIIYEKISNDHEFDKLFIDNIKFILLTLLVISITACLLGLIKLNIKLPEFTYLWLIANLCTCITEELFFRGFVQKNFSEYCTTKNLNNNYAIIFSSIIFGVLHFMGGWKYIILASMAGFAYGHIYNKTNSIYLAITLHYLVNITHFIFFTYPAIRP